MKHLNLLIAILFSCCLFLVDTSVVDAKIVFSAEDGIYVMEDNGTNRRRLTKTMAPINHVPPQWSPDGERIVFTRYMDQDDRNSSELFLMNADGTNVQRLTDNNVDDSYPCWSPDGKKIAFCSRRTGKSRVYVMDLATRGVTQLTALEDEGEGSSAAPDWSSDGRQIVYENQVKIGLNIYVMSADGTNQRPLLPDPDEVRWRYVPRWSLDGQKILFKEYWFHGNGLRSRLTIATLGGRVRVHQVEGLYKNHGDNLIYGIACWIRNDKSLILDIKLPDKPNPNFDIYRYDLNTQTLKRLTDGKQNERYPDWIEGTLSVTPKDKKTVTWGTIKKVVPNLF